MKRLLKILLQIAILVLCLWYLCRDMNYHTFIMGLRSMPWQGALVLLGLLVLSYLAAGLRLKSLVPSLTFTSAVAVEILGNGMNVLLPAKLGEVFKINALAKKAGISKAAGTHFILWTRFSEINLLFFLALATLDQSTVLFFAAIGLCWGGLIVLWITPALPFWLLDKIPFPKMRTFALELAQNLARRPDFLFRLLALGALVWGLYWAQYYWGLTHFLTTPLSLTQINIIFLAAAGIAAVPSTPGALGPYEATLVFLLTSFGVAKEEALAFSLLMRVFMYFPPALAAVAISLRGHRQSESPPTPAATKL